MSEPAEPELLNVTQACDWLGVSPATLRRLVKEGQLRHVRVGKLIRFRLVWLRAYIDANATGPEVGDVEGLWSGDRLPETGWPVGGDVGTSPGKRQAKTGYSDSGHGGRRMEADAGRAARRGTVELSVAASDRKRRIVPRRVAS